MEPLEGVMKKGFVVLAVVALFAFPAQFALAASEIGFQKVGVDLGFVSPEDIDGTIGFGAFADLGTFSPRVGLSAHLGYWSKSEDFFGSETSVSDVAFTGRVRYLFPTASKFHPYAGGGLGMHFLNMEVSTPDIDLGGGLIVPGMSVSDSETKLGIDLGGGFSTPVGTKTDLYGDFWYSMVEDFGQLSMKVGLAWRL
jgi:opacity protein-like surface antigen